MSADFAGLTAAEMWAAFAARDARWDGRFIAAVRSTGIFCRPSCVCRRPRPERVRYFPTADAAARAGYRPCKRCRPELAGGPAEADRRFAERARAAMRARLEEGLTLAKLAGLLGASPSAFARRFRAGDGRTPMRALADLRAERAEALLGDPGVTVLDAGLAAGFGSPSAFLRAFRRRTGKSPSGWRSEPYT
jgi:methylphosphotriester-DNA--protein-cysteine methyltransferase